VPTQFLLCHRVKRNAACTDRTTLKTEWGVSRCIAL
jgi:hypothetical protein